MSGVVKLIDLPPGTPMALDTETSSLHCDDGGRISVVSFAFRNPDTGEIVSQAVPFDQGVNDLPLGPKELDSRTTKRLAKWPEWAKNEVAPNRPPSEFARFIDTLRAVKPELVFANAKFDNLMFNAGLRGREDLGVDLMDLFGWDTMLAQHVREPQMPTGLKPTAVRLMLTEGGGEDEQQKALKPWIGPMSGKSSDPRYDLIPWSVMEPYATADAELTLLLYEYQQLELNVDEDPEAWGLLHHIDREFKLMKTLYRMEQRGIGFDAKACLDNAKVLRAEMDRIANLLPFKGGTGKPTPNSARSFFFADRPPFKDKVTATGQPQVDEEVIARLAKEGVEWAAEYEQHEGLKSALSKWYEAWPARIGNDGRLRTCHRQGRVTSGRLAVERVQLQAIPHDYLIPMAGEVTPIRKLFRPKPGHVLHEFDVSQAEIRIATAVAHCQPMLDGILRGEDSHGIATKLMFQIDETDPKWDQLRQVAKRAQPLDEPVATPTGWCPIGDLKPGDLVFGSNGKPTRVLGIPYQGIDEVWKVKTKSGRTIRCCEQHLWTVTTGRGKSVTESAKHLADRISKPYRNSAAYLLPINPVEFDPVELPIDPYLLGVLLGDGSLVYSNPKWYSLTEDGKEMAERIAGRTADTIHSVPTAHNDRASRFSLRGGATQAALVDLGLAGTKKASKFVPEIYLRGSVQQRYELLRGLMDTDGHRSKSGNIFSSTSWSLVKAVMELVRSLGGVAKISPMHKSRLNRHPGWSEAWFVHVRTPECPFALSRKASKWTTPVLMNDRIVSVIPTGEYVEQRCISVEAEDNLYLTSQYAPTHNCNLGILYGAGAKVIQEQIAKFTGIEYKLRQVKQWVDDWKEAFPQFADALERYAQLAERQGFVRLRNGRERWFSDYEPSHKSFNQCIQGSLAEVMKDLMYEVDTLYPGELLLNVHDSVVLETSNENIETRSKSVCNLMSGRFEEAFEEPWTPGGPTVRVPFVSDQKVWS